MQTPGLHIATSTPHMKSPCLQPQSYRLRVHSYGNRLHSSRPRVKSSRLRLRRCRLHLRTTRLRVQTSRLHIHSFRCYMQRCRMQPKSYGRHGPLYVNRPPSQRFPGAGFDGKALSNCNFWSGAGGRASITLLSELSRLLIPPTDPTGLPLLRRERLAGTTRAHLRVLEATAWR